MEGVSCFWADSYPMFAQGTHGIQRCPSAVAHWTWQDPIGILKPPRWPVNLGAGQSCVAALKITTAILLLKSAVGWLPKNATLHSYNLVSSSLLIWVTYANMFNCWSKKVSVDYNCYFIIWQKWHLLGFNQCYCILGFSC